MVAGGSRAAARPGATSGTTASARRHNDAPVRCPLDLDLDHPRPGHPVAGRRPAVAVVVVAPWETSNAEPSVAPPVALARDDCSP
jgi:hypothetical protein